MIQSTSEVAEFFQKGSNRYQVGYKETYDKNDKKTKQLFKCGKEVHPSSNCTEGNNKHGKKHCMEEAMRISPHLVNPVNQASLTSVLESTNTAPSNLKYNISMKGIAFTYHLY